MCTLPTHMVAMVLALLAPLSALASGSPSATTTQAEQGSDTIRISGRVVLPNGKPAAGASVLFNAWRPDNDRETSLGLPDYEGEPSTTADDRGDFELEVAQSDADALGYSLDVRLPGYTTLTWMFPELDTSEPMNLGRVRLEESGRVLVRLLDSRGAPLRQAFTAAAWSHTQYGHGGTNAVRAGADASSGLATLDGLSEGQVAVTLLSGSGSERLRGTALVIAGETTEVELRLEGPDPRRTIVVDLVSDPYPFLSWRVEGVTLIAPDGTQVKPDKHEHSNWVFQDLTAEEYTLRIDDPSVERVERAGLTPGKRALALVRPSSGVELDLVDAASGAEIERFELTVRWDDMPGRPNTFRLRSQRRRPPEDRYFPVPTERCTLLLDVEGYGRTTVSLEALSVGERRRVRVELERAVTIRGRVLQHDGVTPVAESFVCLRNPGEAIRYHDGSVLSSTPQPPPLLALRADRDGRFEFQCAPGEYALHVVHDAWSDASVDPFVVSIDRTDELVVRLPETWTLHGKLSGGDLDSIAGLRVQPAPRADSNYVALLSSNRSVPIADDGSFRVDMLPTGDVGLYLVMPERSDDGVSSTPGFYFPESVVQIGTVNGTAGDDLRRVFELADRWPCSLSVELSVDDEAAAEYRILLRSTAEDGKRSELVLDDDGRDTLRCIQPGEYSVLVGPSLGGGVGHPRWTVTLPATVRLEAGELTYLEHSLALSTGRVQAVDAKTGDPLAGWSLMLQRDGGADPAGTTDHEGWFELTLPAGVFHLERARFGRADADELWHGSIEWTDDGPRYPALQLKRL